MPNQINERTRSRFDAKWEADDFGCHVWKASRQSSGYGQFSFNGAPVLAHRMAYVMARGEIPDGLVIHHVCYNRSCVNVEHLVAVTQRENLLDERSSSPCREASLKTHCPRGHAYDDANTLLDAGKRKCKTCKYAYHRAWQQGRKAA